jgi:putative transposase
VVNSQLRRSEPCRRNGITPKRSFRSLGKPTFCWAKDKSVSQAGKQIGVSDQIYYRWRKSYGGMKVDQARRLKELEVENADPNGRMRMGDEKAPQNPDFRLALWIGAAVLVGVAIMIGVDWPTETSAPAPGATPGGVPALMPPPVAPPPIQSAHMVADQLFNRAMTAHETGQAQQAATLLPEAIMAYQRLEPLDADGLFHLAVLQLAVGNEAGARVTSNRILATAPNHLLGLAAAAQASEKSAPNEAKGLWQRYLDAYDEQQGRAPEYAHHQRIFPTLSKQASEFIARAPGNATLP